MLSNYYFFQYYNDNIGLSKHHKAIKVADIEFADDIALLANSAIDAQTLLQTVEEIGASVTCNTS